MNFYTVHLGYNNDVKVLNEAGTVVAAKAHERLVRRTGMTRTYVVAAYSKTHAVERATRFHNIELLFSDLLDPAV